MPADRPDDEERARSRWASPWLWTLAVVVVVGGALAVSFVAASSPSPEGDDVSAFCPAARAYWQDTALLTNLDLNLPPSTYDAVRSDVARLRETAPASIAPDVRVVTEGVDQLATKLQAIAARAPGDRGVEAIEEAGQAVQAAGRGRDRSVARLAEYVRSACGFDLAAPPDVPATAPATTTVVPSTTATTSPPTTAGPPEPVNGVPPTSLAPGGVAPSGPSVSPGEEQPQL